MMIAGRQRSPYRIVSSIPGRVRLQFVRGCVRKGMLAECERRLQGLAGVQQIRVAADAGSLIVVYDRRQRPLTAMLVDIETVAAAISPAYILAARGDGSRSHSLSSDAQSPLALKPPHDISERMPPASFPSLRTASHQGELQASGKTEIKRARDMPADKKPGYKPLLIPSLAVALSALEALPVAVTSAALALAALPIVRRAGEGVRGRKLTVDQLDLANVAWLAIRGEFLVASVISWLISLGELMRGRTVRNARIEIERLRQLAERSHQVPGMENSQRARHVLATLENAPLSDTVLHDRTTEASCRVAWPVFALGVAISVITRDPSDFIGIVKPRTDFTYGQGFALPASLLNAMTATTREGPLFKSGRAIEKLAQADAVVFNEFGRSASREQLDSLLLALLERNIKVLVMPDAKEERAAREMADRMGVSDLMIEVSGKRGEEVMRHLRGQGHAIAIIDRRIGDLRAFREEDVRISLDPAADLDNPLADIIFLDDDLWDLPRAIDHARQTMRVLKQNTTIAASAATFNFIASLLRLSPAPLSSLVNTGAIAAEGFNALRPLRTPQNSRTSSRLPESDLTREHVIR